MMANLPPGMSYGPGGVATGSVTTTADPYYRQRQIDKLAQVAQMFAEQKKQKEAELYAQVQVLLEDPGVDPDLGKNSEAMRKLRKRNPELANTLEAAFDAKKDSYNIRLQGIQGYQAFRNRLEQQPTAEPASVQVPGMTGVPMPPINFVRPIPVEEQMQRAYQGMKPEDLLGLNFFLNSQRINPGNMGIPQPNYFNQDKLPPTVYAMQNAANLTPDARAVARVKGGIDPSVSLQESTRRYEEQKPYQAVGAAQRSEQLRQGRERIRLEEERLELAKGQGGKTKRPFPKGAPPSVISNKISRYVTSGKIDSVGQDKLKAYEAASTEILNGLMTQRGMTRQEAIDVLNAYIEKAKQMHWIGETEGNPSLGDLK